MYSFNFWMRSFALETHNRQLFDDMSILLHHVNLGNEYWAIQYRAICNSSGPSWYHVTSLIRPLTVDCNPNDSSHTNMILPLWYLRLFYRLLPSYVVSARSHRRTNAILDYEDVHVVRQVPRRIDLEKQNNIDSTRWTCDTSSEVSTFVQIGSFNCRRLALTSRSSVETWICRA
jgi:hypothetical protein